jgi:Lrp/AsnC family leucine-responsive transcriptional regulator
MRKILNQIDDRLLALLEQDGRMPLKALAAEVGLSTSAVQERIKRLKAEGDLLGFTIRRPDRAEVTRAFIMVSTDVPNCARMAPVISAMPGVTTIDSISGKPDMIVSVEVESAERLQDIRDAIAEMDHVVEVECKVSMVRRYERG